MIVETKNRAEIAFICERLRESSWEEVECFMPRDPETVARYLATLGGFQWVAYGPSGVPAAVIGAHIMHPGVWGLYGLGTDEYAAVLRDVTNHCRKVMMPAVIEAGAHRGQAISPAHHIEAHKWLRRLGAHEEATLEAYGRNREDMKLFAWINEDGANVSGRIEAEGR